MNLIKRIVNKFYRSFLNKKDIKFIYEISRSPLNASLHMDYAIHAINTNRPYLALAEMKTAAFLDPSNLKIKNHISLMIPSMPNLEIMDHNQYYRFKSLSSELNDRSNTANYSVLDVGGGVGQLAAFIPEASYCLAEPKVNGISGTDLPFKDQSFDFVVSCHVLEHIPIESRKVFLDQLISKSKIGLILLNPFHISGSHEVERLNLILDVTGADWAKEHLECTLPTIDFVEGFAKERNLEVSIKPNGVLTTTLAFVFAAYFSNKSNSKSDLEKINQINQFYNVKFYDILKSDNYPTGYLIYLGR